MAATYAQTLGRDVDADGLGAGLTALADGAALADLRGFNHTVLDLGYTIEAQYSATGQASFIQVYAPNGFQPVLLTQSQQVPYDQSASTPNPDRVVLDLYKVSSDASIGVTFQLDGRYLGRAAVTAPSPEVPYQTAVDEITLLGPFGTGLHDLRIMVDDPCVSPSASRRRPSTAIPSCSARLAQERRAAWTCSRTPARNRPLRPC